MIKQYPPRGNSLSTSNSSTTPLGIGATFTGTWHDISQYAAIAIAVKSDQDSAALGFKLQWSTDASNIVHEQTESITGGTSSTRQAMLEAKYFRIVYINGGTAQTSFILQTIYMRIPSVGEIQQLGVNIDDMGDAQLVRAVLSGKQPGGDYTNVQTTTAGNLKLSLEEFDPTFLSNPLPITEKAKTAFGEVLMGQLSPQFQGSFEYTVDNTDLNINTEVAGGTVTQSLGMAVLTSSITTASTALFQSKQHAKYRPGLGGVSRFTALYTTPVAATEQYIGLADEVGSSAAFKNGYVIGYDGTTFGFHRFQNDSKITTALSLWDDPLDGSGPSGVTIDTTKLNIFFIQYQYLGAGAIRIWYEKPNGDLVKVYTVEYANTNTEPSTHNPNFHHVIWVSNGATTDSLTLKSSSYAYFVEGKTSFIELHQPENASGTKEKTTVTTEVAIFTIRNKATYASKTNFIDIILLGAGASIEASSANNLGTVRVVKNATLGGVPSYSDINTSNSVLEIDISGTTVSGGKELGAGGLAGKNDSLQVPLIHNRIILNPGETLTLAGSSANSATIRSQASWRELF